MIWHRTARKLRRRRNINAELVRALATVLTLCTWLPATASEQRVSGTLKIAPHPDTPRDDQAAAPQKLSFLTHTLGKTVIVKNATVPQAISAVMASSLGTESATYLVSEVPPATGERTDEPRDKQISMVLASHVPLGLALQVLADRGHCRLSVLPGRSPGLAIYNHTIDIPQEIRIVEVDDKLLEVLPVAGPNSEKPVYLMSWFCDKGVTRTSNAEAWYYPNAHMIVLLHESREVELMSTILKLRKRGFKIIPRTP